MIMAIPSKEADSSACPYHNIREWDYPPMLVTTADVRMTVVPGHSFKYTAALQAVDCVSRI
jgi:prolyl oligopeptidase